MAETAKGFSVNGEEYKIDYNSLVNRPPQFGGEATEVFLPMQTDVEFEYDDSGSVGYYYIVNSIPTLNQLIFGETYVVNWDGVEYETECFLADTGSTYSIGDKYFYKGNIIHDYPFIITCGSTPNPGVYSLNAVSTYEGGNKHSFSITHKFITRLSSKYLPYYLNMDAHAEQWITQATGTSSSSTSEIPVSGTPFNMYRVENYENNIYPTGRGIPVLGDTYLVTINGVEHEALCRQGGGGYVLFDKMAIENGSEPSFLVDISTYGGFWNLSMYLYLSTANTVATWSAKHITHNVLPMEYAPLLINANSASSTPITIVEALNQIATASKMGVNFVEYHFPYFEY